MTIARGLDSEKKTKAKEQFNTTEINFEFTCDSLHII